MSYLQSANGGHSRSGGGADAADRPAPHPAAPGGGRKALLLAFLAGVLTTLVVLVAVAVGMILHAKRVVTERLEEGERKSVTAGPRYLPPPRPADFALESGPTVESWAWSVAELGKSSTSAAAFQGQPLFLHFWATWCAPCVPELATIDRTFGEFRGKGLAFVVVSDEPEEQLRAFARQHGLHLPLFTVASQLPPQLTPRAMPTTFLITRDGRVAFRHTGAVDWSTPEAAAILNALLDFDPGRRP